MEQAGIPWENPGPHGQDMKPQKSSRDPLGEREPLEGVRTPWEQQGPLISSRDSLEVAGMP